MVKQLLQSKTGKQVIAVDLADLGDRAQRMAAKAKELNDKLDEIQAEVDELDGVWADANRDRFMTYFINLHSALAAQASYFDAYAEALADAKRTYEGLQNEVDALFAES